MNRDEIFNKPVNNSEPNIGDACLANVLEHLIGVERSYKRRVIHFRPPGVRKCVWRLNKLRIAECQQTVWIDL